MDSIDWSNTLEESLIMSGSNSLLCNNNSNTVSSKLDTYNSVEQMQKNDILFNVLSQWNSRSGAGSGWGVAVNAGTTSRSLIECSSPSALNTIPPLQNSIIHDSSNLLDHPPLATNTAASFESLDCLLSASTSLTDTTSTSADQDDGIYLILSDCQNSGNFVKSGKRISPVSRNSEEIINNQHRSPANDSKRKKDATREPIRLNFQSNYSGHGGFQLISENHQKPKKPRLDKPAGPVSSSSNINFQQTSSSASSADEPDAEAIAQMKEIIYRAAAFRPVNFGAEVMEKPKRKNVRVSSDPQTVAARQRRERISERIRVLQNLVPGGSKMDTASMLDEAANYLKFLRSQVKALEALGQKSVIDPTIHNFPANTNLAFSPFLGYSFTMQQQPQFSIHNPNQFKS